jgi:hypothetical protein
MTSLPAEGSRRSCASGERLLWQLEENGARQCRHLESGTAPSAAAAGGPGTRLLSPSAIARCWWWLTPQLPSSALWPLELILLLAERSTQPGPSRAPPPSALSE